MKTVHLKFDDDAVDYFRHSCFSVQLLSLLSCRITTSGKFMRSAVWKLWWWS